MALKGLLLNFTNHSVLHWPNYIWEEEVVWAPSGFPFGQMNTWRSDTPHWQQFNKLNQLKGQRTCGSCDVESKNGSGILGRVVISLVLGAPFVVAWLPWKTTTLHVVFLINLHLLTLPGSPITSNLAWVTVAFHSYPTPLKGLLFFFKGVHWFAEDVTEECSQEIMYKLKCLLLRRDYGRTQEMDKETRSLFTVRLDRKSLNERWMGGFCK